MSSEQIDASNNVIERLEAEVAALKLQNHEMMAFIRGLKVHAEVLGRSQLASDIEDGIRRFTEKRNDEVCCHHWEQESLIWTCFTCGAKRTSIGEVR